MDPYSYFVAPILDQKAQVAIIALSIFAAMDVIFGVLNAWFFQAPYRYFVAPILDQKAQVAIIALFIFAAMDVIFGVLNAWFFQHDFSSHEFRQGLIRKLSNFGVVIAADVVDAMLLGGLDLGWQPVLMTVTISLAIMELASLMEIFAEMHPEISESEWWRMLAHSKDSLHAEPQPIAVTVSNYPQPIPVAVPVADPDKTADLGRRIPEV